MFVIRDYARQFTPVVFFCIVENIFFINISYVRISAKADKSYH